MKYVQERKACNMTNPGIGNVLVKKMHASIIKCLWLKLRDYVAINMYLTEGITHNYKFILHSPKFKKNPKIMCRI